MNIAVYCGSNPHSKSRYIACAEEFGRWIGESGNSLVYGGSSIGLMGAVSRAVLASGGEVYGVEPSFFIEAGVAQHHLTELIEVETMTERRLKMIELADVYVALPGGVGTLEEISEIMSRIRLSMTAGPCYFLNLDNFYSGLKELLGKMVEANFLDEELVHSFIFADSVDELTLQLGNLDIADLRSTGVPIVPRSNLIG